MSGSLSARPMAGSRYISHGLFVGADVAGLFAPLLRSTMNADMRNNGLRRPDPLMLEFVDHIERLAQAEFALVRGTAVAASASRAIGAADDEDSLRAMGWLTVKEAAERLGITRRAVNARIERVRLEARRVRSGAWLVWLGDEEPDDE